MNAVGAARVSAPVHDWRPGRRRQRLLIRVGLAVVLGPLLAFILTVILVKWTGWTFLAFHHIGLRPCYCVEAYEDPPSGNDPIHPMIYFNADYTATTKFSELTNYPTVRAFLAQHAYVDGVLIYWPSAASSGTSGKLVLLSSFRGPSR